MSILKTWKWTPALFKYFSRVSNLPSTEDTNIGVAAAESANAEVQRVMKDTENGGHKHKLYTAFTPEQRVSIGRYAYAIVTVIVKYWHV